MLIRLLPEQISAYWDVISKTIERSLPPTVTYSPNVLNKILKALLVEDMICWAASENAGEKMKVVGFIVTTFVADAITGDESLLIYSMSGLGEPVIDNAIWIDGLKTLHKFAKASSCSKIVGYTDVRGVINFVKRMGGDTSRTFVSLDV